MGGIKKIKEALGKGMTDLYYRKYFKWGLPPRRFIQVNIETNSVCTRRCAHCIFGIRDVPVERMEPELFFGIIDELARMRFRGRISLFELNEPLTDKRIYDFTRYVGAVLPRCYHLMVTNGDLLTEERLHALMEAGVDLLLVNSYDEGSNARNLKLVRHGARVYGDKKVQHVDRTGFSAWESRACHLKEYAAEAVRDFCEYPNYILYIKPDGRVLGCWNDFDGVNVMGKLGSQSVSDVWYGREFREFRHLINRRDRRGIALCSRCDHSPNVPYMRWNRLLAEGKMNNGDAGPALPEEAGRIKKKYLTQTGAEAETDVR